MWFMEDVICDGTSGSDGEKMANILFICYSRCPTKTPMCSFFIHLHMIMIAWLKERLVPTVAACSSLIRMLHQISTEIQRSNESSSTWRWGGLVCHVPCHMKIQTAAKWWHMKGKAKGWGVLKPLWRCYDAETRSQLARWMVSTPTAAPAVAASRLQILTNLSRRIEQIHHPGSPPCTTAFVKQHSGFAVDFLNQVTQQYHYYNHTQNILALCLDIMLRMLEKSWKNLFRCHLCATV